MSRAQVSVPLGWDPGTTAEGTVFVEQTTAVATDYIYRVRAENPSSGAWRTVLKVTSGNADLYMRRGETPNPLVAATVDYKSTRSNADDGVVLTPAGQFTVGEDYYILVRAAAGSVWRLVSGDIYVENLGKLSFTDANGDGKFDPGEAVLPQATAARTVGGEGEIFYKATVPDGAPAWTLYLNGLTSKIAVRKNIVPLQSASLFDTQKPSRMLLVPDYLQASTAGSAYFISVAANPGTAVSLDSRIHSFTDIAFESSVSVSGTGAGYRTYRVTVPPDQLAWQVSATPQTGDPNLCLRRDNVGSENDNNAYSEIGSTTTVDSITLSPASAGSPADGLTDGTFFITLYSPGDFTATLRNGAAIVTDIDYVSSTVNDTPDRAGWRFYRVSDIESQVGLGWELELSSHEPNTEIAIRRNAVPSRWQFRSGGSVSTSQGILNLSSTTGLLQDPRHQRDVWYVGIYQPTVALGTFTLRSRQISAAPLDFTNGSIVVPALVPGRNTYWRINVPADAKGWKLDITGMLPVTGTTDAQCDLALARDVVPSLQDNTESAIPSVIGNSDLDWPSSKQLKITRSLDLVPLDKDGDNSRRYSVILPMGQPLQPGTYYLGARPKTVDTKFQILSRGIGVGAAWALPVNPLAFSGAGANPTVPSLALGEAAFYKTVIPPGTHSWEVTLDASVGESLLAVQRNFIPGMSSTESNAILRTGGTVPGGLLMRRNGADRVVLMEGSGVNELPPGDYYVAVVSQGTAAPAGQTLGPATPVLRSVGELIPQPAGTLGLTPLTVDFNLAAAQIAAYEVTLPAGLRGVEVSLSPASGNPFVSMWTGSPLRFPQPPFEGDRYGYEGGEPNATVSGVAQRLSNNTKPVLTFPNPAAGTYRLLLRAAKFSGAFEPATGTLTIKPVHQSELAFQDGKTTITSQPEESWCYFGVDVPAAALGWELRVANVPGGMSAEVIIRRDLIPPGGTQSVGASAADWPSGAYFSVGTDWTGIDTNPDGTKNYGCMLPMGKPLQAGRYYVGVKARGGNIGYTISSRGLFSNVASCRAVPPCGSNPAPIEITALPFRESALFCFEVPDETPSLLIQADAHEGNQDFRVAIRQGGLPGSVSGSSVSSPHGVMVTKSELGITPLEEEWYLVLPPAGSTKIAPGIYYVAVISQGNPAVASPGANTIDVSLKVCSHIPVEHLGTVPAGEDVLVERPFDLRAGSVVVYEADIAPNPSGRSAGIVPESGVSSLASLSLPDGRTPRPSTPVGDTYGFEGGAIGAGYLASSAGSAICQDIPEGVNRFIVRSSRIDPAPWASSSGVFYIGSCSLFPVLSFNGGEESDILNGKSWMHYKVTVPAGAAGWDLKCISNGSPEMYIRKLEPNETTAASVNSISTQWPNYESYQVASSDWSTVSQAPDGRNLLWSVLPMNQPLVPGVYYISLRNNSNTALNYTLLSKGIGTGYLIPVEPLQFSGAGSESVPAPLDAKTAGFFKFTVPSGQRSWEVACPVTDGDVTLAIRKDRIPGSRANNLGPYQGHGLVFDKPGNERTLLLPDNGQEFIAAGDYYAAIVSKGAGGTSTRGGALPAVASIRSAGSLPVESLGIVNTAHPVSLPVVLDEAQIKVYEFEIDAAKPGVEVRLDNRAGIPRLALWTGDPRYLPEPPLTSPKYGFWGGSQTSGTSIRYEQDAIYTMSNVAPGRYRLVLRACPGSGTFPAASCTLSITEKANVPLAFGPQLATPSLPSRHQDQLVKGQKNVYRVEVPVDYNGTPVPGWLLYVRQLSGSVNMRVFQQGLATPKEIAIAGQNSVVLAPPWFTPGQTWYVAVEGEGLAEYEIESRPVQLEQAVWTLPGTFNTNFGDSAPSPEAPERPLAQDDWHFYAVNIPEGNAGVLRTMLESISGNPDLYLRAGYIPTSDHRVTGTTGAALYDRRLNGTTTEYGNWVPDKGRAETQLAPATWYLGVKAASTRNASYRLRAASGSASELNPSGGSVTGISLAGGDWRYFHFTAPSDAPATWKLNFARTQGNALLFIRDTNPPGNYDSATSLRTDSTDNKNSATYQGGGYGTGLITYTNPALRAGHHYWVGIQALSDTEFSLSSTTEGSLSSIPELAFTNGVFTGPLNPGETRLFRVPTPLRATQFNAALTNSTGVSGRIEQSSPPVISGGVHGSFSSTFTRNMTTDPLTTWPWIAGYDFYLRLTNTGTTVQTPTLTLSGSIPPSPDTDNDGLLDTWERAQFSNSLTSNSGMDDPDRDGVVNMMEQALGTPPLSTARTTQPVMVRLDSAGRLVMTVAKPAGLDLSMLRYTVEFSPDLTNWSDKQSVVLQNTASVLEVRDHIATSGALKRCVRLKVTRVP